MNIGRFKIHGDDASEKVKAFLQEHYKKCLQKDHIGLLLIWNEHFYFRTDSALLYTIVLDYREKQVAYIEVVCGGGGVGFFGITLWSEKSSITTVWKDLDYFCKNNDLQVSPAVIEDKGTSSGFGI